MDEGEPNWADCFSKVPVSLVVSEDTGFQCHSLKVPRPHFTPLDPCHHTITSCRAIYERLIGIIEALDNDAECALIKHPEWSTENGVDARYTIFGTTRNILQNACTSVAILDCSPWVFFSTTLGKYLPLVKDTTIVAAGAGKYRLTEDGTTASDRTWANYETLARAGLVLLLASIIESHLRVYHRALSQSPPRIDLPFENVCGQLFRIIYPRCKNLRREAKQAFDMFREIRNAGIHRNAMYHSQDGKNKQLHYRHAPFIFEHRKPVNFLHWTFLLVLIDDLRKIINDIVTSDALQKIPKIDYW